MQPSRVDKACRTRRLPPGAGVLQDRQLHSVGEVVVCLAVEFSASLALMDAAPLLEEERDSASLALIPKRQHPFLLHRPGTRPALTADDHPVDSVKADLAWVLQQWLDGQEPDSGWGLLKMLDPNEAVGLVLDANPPPYIGKVGGELQPRLKHVSKSGRSLGQHLVGVPVGPLHDATHGLDVAVRHILMEQRL